MGMTGGFSGWAYMSFILEIEVLNSAFGRISTGLTILTNQFGRLEDTFFFFKPPRYFKKIWRYSMSARCQWRTLPALWSWWIAVLPSSPIKWNKAQKNATSSKSKSCFEHQKSDISIFASGLVGLRQVLPSFPWLMGITGYLSQHSNKNQGARSQQEGHIRERWCLWGAWGECFSALS